MAEPQVDRAYTYTTCASCGVEFGSPILGRRLKDAASFYCPNGHSNWWGKSEADKLREQLAAEKQRVWAAEEKARLARIEANDVAARLVTVEKRERRLKKRIANGVCPCCHRSFLNVQRHMKTKHPNYQEQSA